MKNLLYITALFFIISGCKKADNNNASVSIIGQWKQISVVTEYSFNNKVLLRDTLVIPDDNYVLEFKANGQYTGSSNGSMVTGTYSTSNNNTTITQLLDPQYSGMAPPNSRGTIYNTGTPMSIPDNNTLLIMFVMPLYGAYDGPPVTTSTTTDKNGNQITYDKWQVVYTYKRNQ